MNLLSSLSPAYAEIFLLTMVSLILIVDLFIVNNTKTATYFLTLFTLSVCSFIPTLTYQGGITHLFNHMFVNDPMSIVLKVFTCISVMTMLVYSRSYLMVRGLFTGEFLALVLFATLGMMVMISASNFLTLYLGLELLALSLYTLVALQRDSSVATEAAMKYFILGAMASGFLLYGMSMLYGATGSLDVNRIAQVILNGTPNKALLVFGLAFIVAGLAFKLGAVPFHMWVPDVYHGAPTAMTMFIGSAPKLAAFAFVMRLLVEDPRRAVHGRGQHHRHCANQHQAHAGLFDHRPYGFHAGWYPERNHRRLWLFHVLRHHLCADESGWLWHDHAVVARRL
jgi:NADH-quinone oxidoreductase subunit N